MVFSFSVNGDNRGKGGCGELDIKLFKGKCWFIFVGFLDFLKEYGNRE